MSFLAAEASLCKKVVEACLQKSTFLDRCFLAHFEFVRKSVCPYVRLSGCSSVRPTFCPCIRLSLNSSVDSSVLSELHPFVRAFLLARVSGMQSAQYSSIHPSVRLFSLCVMNSNLPYPSIRLSIRFDLASFS